MLWLEWGGRWDDCRGDGTAVGEFGGGAFDVVKSAFVHSAPSPLIKNHPSPPHPIVF